MVDDQLWVKKDFVKKLSVKSIRASYDLQMETVLIKRTKYSINFPSHPSSTPTKRRQKSRHTGSPLCPYSLYFMFDDPHIFIHRLPWFIPRPFVPSNDHLILHVHQTTLVSVANNT